MHNDNSFLRYIKNNTVIQSCKIPLFGELVDGFMCVSKDDYKTHNAFAECDIVPNNITIGTGFDHFEALECYSLAYQFAEFKSANQQSIFH